MQPATRRAPRFIAAAMSLLAVSLLAGAGAAPAPETGFLVVVSNEYDGTLSLIDGTTRQVLSTTEVGKRPRGIQPSPDGTVLFVALSGSPMAPPGTDESALPPPDKKADGIGIFDLGNRELTRIIKGVSDPEQLAVGSDGATLYVASEDTGRAIVQDVASGRVLASLPVGGEPEGVGIRPDGAVVYVTSEEDHRVTVIDTATQRVIKTFDVGARPRAVAFTPDGRRAFVTGETDGTVTAIDAVEHKVIEHVTLPGDGQRPMGVVVSPDGRSVYIATGRGKRVYALDADTLEVRGWLSVGERPWGIAISPDGRWLFTANGPSDDVSVIDAERLAELERIAVGERPWGVAVVPFGGPERVSGDAL